MISPKTAISASWNSHKRSGLCWVSFLLSHKFNISSFHNIVNSGGGGGGGGGSCEVVMALCLSQPFKINKGIKTFFKHQHFKVGTYT